MQEDKEKMLTSLSRGDRTRQLFFQNIFKILDQDEFESDSSAANSIKTDSNLNPINLSLNIFQSYESQKKKAQTLTNSRSKSNLNHSYIETETNTIGRGNYSKKQLPSQNKRSIPPIYSSSLKKN